MGQVTPRFGVKFGMKVVRAGSKAALVAAAAKECEQQTTQPSCERVLVVYGENAAKLYIEKTPPTPRPAVRRRLG